MHVVKNHREKIIRLLGCMFLLGMIHHNSLHADEIGKFSFPVDDKYRTRISSSQGIREAITDNAGGSNLTQSIYHNAIDIAVPDQTPVFATKDGTVVDVYPGYFNGPKWQGHTTYGGLIIIQHDDGTMTMYAHLSKTYVTEGDRVTDHQNIGLSGGVRGRRASGQSTGPHLHYAIFVSIANLTDNVWWKDRKAEAEEKEE